MGKLQTDVGSIFKNKEHDFPKGVLSSIVMDDCFNTRNCTTGKFLRTGAGFIKPFLSNKSKMMQFKHSR